MIRHLILLHSSNMNLIYTNKYWYWYMDQHQKLSKDKHTDPAKPQISGPHPPPTEQK